MLTSSPVRRSGSTLNLAPSSSPTPSSLFEPLVSLPDCVPPVIRSVFSGTASLGTKLGSADDSISGSGACLPTPGIPLAMAEIMFVRWGFRGFSACFLRHSVVVSLPRSLMLRRGMNVEKGREKVRRVREGRRISRVEGMMSLWPIEWVLLQVNCYWW